MIEIWKPRYKDSTVLIASYKIVPGENEIIFTKAKHLMGKVFSIQGSDIARYPLCYNGRIECYVVPLSALKLKYAAGA